jgi:hypothetical protein
MAAASGAGKTRQQQKKMTTCNADAKTKAPGAPNARPS